jgi:hypothetical protein
VARQLLPDPADREIRDRLDIAGWVQTPRCRRAIYFSWCDQVLEKLRSILGNPNEDPPDEAVIQILFYTLRNDRTFWKHVTRKRAEYPAGHSDQIHRIGAATIYYEYLVAKETGSWP